jgi:DNA-binding NarL/FixJ family response regulator
MTQPAAGAGSTAPKTRPDRAPDHPADRTTPISVFLVDDHAVVRRGLASYLEGEADLAIAGQAGTGRSALAEIAVLANTGGLPDIVLMDLVMPDLDGITATREIHTRWPSIAVIAVTSFSDETKVRAVLDAGASGYLLKDAEADDIAAAIRTAHRGEVALAPSVARTLLDSVRKPTPPPGSQLTTRETQVIALVARGYTNQQIATTLGVAERTARTHVSNILTKLGLTSRTQAALWASENGLLPSGEAQK